jgi:hypothetical protein
MFHLSNYQVAIVHFHGFSPVSVIDRLVAVSNYAAVIADTFG